jgi:hypothetical protein
MRQASQQPIDVSLAKRTKLIGFAEPFILVEDKIVFVGARLLGLLPLVVVGSGWGRDRTMWNICAVVSPPAAMLASADEDQHGCRPNALKQPM